MKDVPPPNPPPPPPKKTAMTYGNQIITILSMPLELLLPLSNIPSFKKTFIRKVHLN